MMLRDENSVVYQAYTEDREARFEVYRNGEFYEVWVQRRITEEYMGPDWFSYCDIPDHCHRADTLERAVEIGRECLRCLG